MEIRPNEVCDNSVSSSLYSLYLLLIFFLYRYYVLSMQHCCYVDVHHYGLSSHQCNTLPLSGASVQIYQGAPGCLRTLQAQPQLLG